MPMKERQSCLEKSDAEHTNKVIEREYMKEMGERDKEQLYIAILEKIQLGHVFRAR